MDHPPIEYPLGAIAGAPGTTWTNPGPRTLWQLHVSWINSCARCIQNDGVLAPWWPIPHHEGCACRQDPVPPGGTSRPFVDFRARFAALPDGAKDAAFGGPSWRLLEAGLVAWPDVVTRSRVRPFPEVVDRGRFTADQLVAAGVPRPLAEAAIGAVNTPERRARDARAREAIGRLQERGVSPEEIRRAIRDNLVGRFGLGDPRSKGDDRGTK